jgi:uncharacterized repeat protein (TIGR03803 family)
VFAVDLKTRKETQLYNFTGGSDGGEPAAALISVGGLLYGTTYSGGTSKNGTVFSINPTTGVETVICSFGGGNDAAKPQSALINVGGLLFGTTGSGGAFGSGTVFSVDPATGIEKVVHSFTGGSDGGFSGYPGTGLTFLGGKLHGTTKLGGSGGTGIVYSIDPTSGALTVLHNFTGGYYGESSVGGALLNVGGTLYGASGAGGTHGAGSLFSINPSTGTETTLFNFGGGKFGTCSPSTTLAEVNGTLYGVSAACGTNYLGTVFSYNLATGAEAVVYNFGDGLGGLYPNGTLIRVGEKLFGTTDGGGLADGGTVYSIDSTTGTQELIYSFLPYFGSSANNLINANGRLLLSASAAGTAGFGEVVEIAPSTGVATELSTFTGSDNGLSPTTGLISLDGRLYGAACGGGDTGNGAVFWINRRTGLGRLVYSFAGGSDGGCPNQMISMGGTLYGTTYGGGTVSKGTLFSINPATGAKTVLYNFAASSAGAGDGADPDSALINVGGTLYGFTAVGGSLGYGTVFSFNPTTRAETVLHSFGGVYESSTSTEGGLANVADRLYGTTGSGGSDNEGTVFSIDLTSGKERVLYSFNGSTAGGYSPETPLINVGGKLYGTTGYGGAFKNGVLFSFDPKTHTETVLHAFTGGADGGSPGVLIHIGGVLYGTTATGGGDSRGTVFALTP